MKAVSQTNYLECYLLILRSEDREFLSFTGDALPMLRVPERQRMPPYIVDGLKAHGVGAICRFISRKSQTDTARVVVMDVVEEQSSKTTHTWLPTTLLEGFEANGLKLTEVLTNLCSIEMAKKAVLSVNRIGSIWFSGGSCPNWRTARSLQLSIGCNITRGPDSR